MTTGDGDLFFKLIFVPVPALGRGGKGRLPSQFSHFSVIDKALFLLSKAGLGVLVLEKGGVPLAVDENANLPSKRSFAFDTEL